nr:lantibiotic dehydratase [Nonomuraea aurantiaca]
MGEQPRFVAAGVALLRMPAASRSMHSLAGADDEEAFLAKALRDPPLREALEVSSDSLAGVLDRIEAGQAVEASKRRRAAMATARYALRMAGPLRSGSWRASPWPPSATGPEFAWRAPPARECVPMPDG